MTSGCRCAEKDLCQTALMRSKTVIQFRAAVSWRRRIIKLRFADANRGIMGQLCKSWPIWKWTKKVQFKIVLFQISCIEETFLCRKKKNKKTLQPACGPEGRPSAGAGKHGRAFPQTNRLDPDDGRTCVYSLRADYNPFNPTYINHNIPHPFRIWMWCAVSPF